ncbi:hypothetical protein V2G26_013988 [Clonostachys chloroleuca]
MNFFCENKKAKKSEMRKEAGDQKATSPHRIPREAEPGTKKNSPNLRHHHPINAPRRLYAVSPQNAGNWATAIPPIPCHRGPSVLSQHPGPARVGEKEKDGQASRDMGALPSPVRRTGIPKSQVEARTPNPCLDQPPLFPPALQLCSSQEALHPC